MLSNSGYWLERKGDKSCTLHLDEHKIFNFIWFTIAVLAQMEQRHVLCCCISYKILASTHKKLDGIIKASKNCSYVVLCQQLKCVTAVLNHSYIVLMATNLDKCFIIEGSYWSSLWQPRHSNSSYFQDASQFLARSFLNRVIISNYLCRVHNLIQRLKNHLLLCKKNILAVVPVGVVTAILAHKKSAVSLGSFTWICFLLQ